MLQNEMVQRQNINKTSKNSCIRNGERIFWRKMTNEKLHKEKVQKQNTKNYIT